MPAKSMLAAVVFFSFMFVSGCSTAKGISSGIDSTAKGICQDSKALWEKALKADDWMKENLW